MTSEYMEEEEQEEVEVEWSSLRCALAKMIGAYI